MEVITALLASRRIAISLKKSTLHDINGLVYDLLISTKQDDTSGCQNVCMDGWMTGLNSCGEMIDIEYLVFVIGLSVKKIQNVDRRMKNIGILEEKNYRII